MKDTGSARTTQIVELTEFQSHAPVGPNALSPHLGLLQGVKVQLCVMVGQASMTLGELMALKEAAIIKVDRSVDYPVDVLVNGNVIARGQLVAVDDQFGVRVTEIASAAVHP